MLEEPDDVVPIAFEGRVGAYDDVDIEPPPDEARRGLHRLGRRATASRSSSTTPTRDPRGATIAGTDDVDESMLCVPMRYDERVIGVITLSKLGLHQFDAGRPSAAVDPRRPGGDRRRVGPPAQPERAAGRRAAAAARHERRARPEPRPARGGRADRPPHGRRDGHRRMRDQLVGPAGRAPPDAGLLAADLRRGAPGRVRRWPATRRRSGSSSSRSTSIIRVGDPTADAAEVAYLVAEREAASAMLPLVAKGRSIGLVELMSRTDRVFDESALELARTMANEAAMALENARHYQDARRPRRPRPADRLLQPPLPARAPGRGDRPGPALEGAARAADDRSRRLQARQRHLRPPVRRPRPGLDRRADPVDPAGQRRRRPLRRRRVRDHPAGHRPGGRPACGRPDRRRAPTSGPTRAKSTGSIPVGASIGASAFPVDGRTARELIATADVEMYRVKLAAGSASGLEGRDRGFDASPAASRPGAPQARADQPPSRSGGSARRLIAERAELEQDLRTTAIRPKVLPGSAGRTGVHTSSSEERGWHPPLTVRTHRERASRPPAPVDLATPRRLVRPARSGRSGRPGREPAARVSSSSARSPSPRCAALIHQRSAAQLGGRPAGRGRAPRPDPPGAVAIGHRRRDRRRDRRRPRPGHRRRPRRRRPPATRRPRPRGDAGRTATDGSRLRRSSCRPPIPTAEPVATAIGRPSARGAGLRLSSP